MLVSDQPTEKPSETSHPNAGDFSMQQRVRVRVGALLTFQRTDGVQHHGQHEYQPGEHDPVEQHADCNRVKTQQSREPRLVLHGIAPTGTAAG